MTPRQAVQLLALGASVVCFGCSHSDPAGAGINYLGDEPYQTEEPIQLTFSPSVDGRPYYSLGGRYLAYGAGRGTASRQDLCLAVLPGTGGQQLINNCLDNPDSTHKIEAVEYTAMNDDGRIAYIRSIGLYGGFGSTSSSLQLADLNSGQEPRQLLELGRTIPGVVGRADYLLGMTWTGPNEITAMVTTTSIGEQCAFCPIDTLYTGTELVRLRTDQTPTTLTPIAPAGGAKQVAIDVGARQVYLLNGTTINRMPLAGGDITSYHVPPPRPGTVADTVSSIAAGGGRVYYARHTITLVNNIRSETHAIHRVEGHDAESIVFLSGGVRLGDYITVTDDGRRIAFEGISLGARDIFRIEVPQ